MVETIQRKGGSNPVNDYRKYIRLMTVGMSFWLSILPALLLAEYFGITAYGQIATLLGVVGCVFFFFGLIGRQELATRHKDEADPPDCS